MYYLQQLVAFPAIAKKVWDSWDTWDIWDTRDNMRRRLVEAELANAYEHRTTSKILPIVPRCDRGHKMGRRPVFLRRGEDVLCHGSRFDLEWNVDQMHAREI